MDIQVTQKQRLFMDAREDEVLYGGAAGGGKSYVQLIDALVYGITYKGIKQLILRRSFPELERSLIRVMLEMYPQSIYSYNSSKHVLRFNNGSIIDFGFCDNESDVYKYQSAEYDVIRIDECTHFTGTMYEYLRTRTWNELDTYIREVAVPLLTTSTVERLSYENLGGRVRVRTDNADRMMNSKEYLDMTAKKVFGVDSYSALGDAEKQMAREEFKKQVSAARQEVSDYIEDMNKMFASRGLKMELSEQLPSDMAMGYSAQDNVIYVNPDNVFSVDAARFFMGHELVHYALNTLDDASRKRFRDYTREAAKAVGINLNDWTKRYQKSESYKNTANEETYARFYSDLMGSPDMLAELNTANPEVLQDIRDYMKAVSKQRRLPNRAARAAEAAAIAQVDAAIKGVGKKNEAKRNRPLMASVPEAVQEAASVKGEGVDTVEAAQQAASETAPSETAAEAKAKATPSKEYSEFSDYHGFYLDGLSKNHRRILDEDFVANEVWPESRATGFDQSDYEAYRKGLPKIERQFLEDVESVRKHHIDDTEDYALAEELYKYFPKRYSQYTPVESDLVDLVTKENTLTEKYSEFSDYHGFYLDGLSKKHRSILDNDFAANEVWPESRATGFDQSDYEAYRKGLPKVERQFLDDVDSIRKRHIDDTEDYALAEELYKYFPKRYSQYTPVESDLVDLVAKEKALSEKSESKKPDLSEIFPMRSEGQIEMPAEVRSSGFQRIPSSDGKQYTFQQALAGEGKSGREGRARRAEKAMAESLDTDIVVPMPGIPGVSVKVVDSVHNDGTHTRTIRVIPDDSHAKAKRGEYYLLNDTEVKQFKQLGFKGKNGIYDHDFTPEFWNALRTADPEAVRAKSGNGNALEWEDWKFLQLEYQTSLARYMAANGLTPEHFNSNTKMALEDLNRAREYAMNQAWDATYRQANIVADALNKIEKDSTVGSVIIAGLIPFKRTPANILIQGVRYSPIGLLDGLVKMSRALAGGEVTGAEAADRLAQGLTGSGITLLGFMLGSMGMMKASGSDSEREEYYDQMIGNQRYSINIGGKNYTIDWLTPISMPLMAGVELAENAKAEAEVDEEEDFNIKFNRIVSAISTMADPVTNLSLLQGINDALSAYQNNQIGSLATNAAQNYALQFVPTASGQLLRTLDPTRRTTYAPKDSEYPLGKFGEQFVNKLKNKSVLANAPGLVGAAGDLLNGEGWNFSIGNAEYVDQWGRTEQGDENPVLRAFNQFIAPWYSRDFNSTAVDDKLATIFTKNGEQPSVLPATPQNRFTINNKSYYLSGDEFETVKKTIGNLSYRGLEDAFAYKYFDYLDPDAQTYVIEKVYSYARAAAKADYANKHGLELSSTDASTVRKVTEAERNGIGVGQYYIIKQVTKDLKSAAKKEKLAQFGIPEALWDLF